MKTYVYPLTKLAAPKPSPQCLPLEDSQTTSFLSTEVSNLAWNWLGLTENVILFSVTTIKYQALGVFQQIIEY